MSAILTGLTLAEFQNAWAYKYLYDQKNGKN